MKESANILRSVKSLWLGHPFLPGLVPGGLIFGVQPAPVARPFASMEVGLGETEYMSGALYTQDYTLAIRVWTDSRVGQAGAIQGWLEGLLAANTKLGLLSIGAWTLHISLSAVPPLIEMAERLFGQFTLVAVVGWTIQLQEFRT